MHSKYCLARAMISAIENARDIAGFSDYDFRLEAQDNFLHVADDYLDTGTVICICPESRLPKLTEDVLAPVEWNDTCPCYPCVRDRGGKY